MIQESAGMLFRIKADGSQAESELRKVVGAASGLGSEIAKIAGPATLVAGTLLAVGAAAATAAVALFNFTKQAAEFGSELYDAGVQTGLSAEAISALKLAADSSGGSLETAAGSVAKFNVLVGQAAQGNEKAEATLKRYGITAKDTTEAFNQAVVAIAQMTTADQKAAAAKDLFKDKTGQVLKIVDQVNGKFDEYIATAKKLGVTLTQEDLKASDDFGDSLGVLGAQAKIAGVKFAAELMPMVTHAMAEISRFFAENQEVVREWGYFVRETLQGVSTVVSGFREAVMGSLSIISFGLIDQKDTWGIWGFGVRAAINVATAGLSGMIEQLRVIGRITGDNGGEMVPTGGNNTGFNALRPAPKLGGIVGGGSGKGGGGGGANKAEEARRKAVEEAKKEMQAKLALYRQTAEEAAKIDEARLSRGEIDEFEYLKRIRALKEREAQFEATLLLNFSRNEKLKAEERAEAESQTKIAASKVRVEQLTTEIAINKEYNEANKKLAEQVEFQKEQVRLEEERLQKLRQQRQEKNLQYDLEKKQKREQQDPFGLGHVKKGAGDADWELGAGGGLLTGISAGIGGLQAQMPVFQQVGEMLAGTFNQIADAVGNAVKSFVLFGTAGGSFRKFAAEIIASIAQAAIVQSIYELAQGLAMLALFHFTHNPKYAKSATTHFASAAVFGAIGGVAAVAGRVVAGGSFANDSGGGDGGGGNGSSNSSANDRTNYNGQFSGFGNSSTPAGRMIAVMGQLEETAHALHTKITSMPADHVVAIGADGASRELTNAIHGELGTGSRPTEGFKRAFGDAR